MKQGMMSMNNSDKLQDESAMSGAAGYLRPDSQRRIRASTIDRQALGSFIMSPSRQQTEHTSAKVSQESRQAQAVSPVSFSSVKKQA